MWNASLPLVPLYTKSSRRGVDVRLLRDGRRVPRLWTSVAVTGAAAAPDAIGAAPPALARLSRAFDRSTIALRRRHHSQHGHDADQRRHIGKGLPRWIRMSWSVTEIAKVLGKRNDFRSPGLGSFSASILKTIAESPVDPWLLIHSSPRPSIDRLARPAARPGLSSARLTLRHHPEAAIPPLRPPPGRGGSVVPSGSGCPTARWLRRAIRAGARLRFRQGQRRVDHRLKRAREARKQRRQRIGDVVDAEQDQIVGDILANLRQIVPKASSPFASRPRGHLVRASGLTREHQWFPSSSIVGRKLVGPRCNGDRSAS